MHPRRLQQLSEAGELIVLSRGVYRRADAPPPSHPDLLAISRRAPAAVVCLMSALRLWDLTDTMPLAVQIAIRRRSRSPRIDFPPVDSFHFDAKTFEEGVELVEAAPSETVRVYSPQRTVVDVMRFRRRLGEALALSALRAYLWRPGSEPAAVLGYARMLDVEGPVGQAMDGVLS